MPSRLRRLESTAQLALPLHVAGFLKPRGVSLPVDFFLSGTARFASKIGSSEALITANNTMTLATDALALDTVVTVGKLVPWIVQGALLRLERRETVEVLDVFEETRTVSLTSKIREDHLAGAAVTLHAVPIEVDGSFPKGTAIFPVKANWDIYAGDQLLIDTVEHDVMRADFAGVDLITSEKIWQLTLRTGAQRALVDRETIYLRAHPAYARTRALLPAVPALGNILAGPIVLDWVSGTLTGDAQFKETMTVEFLGPSFASLGPKESIDKNYPVVRIPIPTDAQVLWTCADGKVTYNEISKKTTAILVRDSSGKGRFRVVQAIEPNFPPGEVTQWRIQVKSIVPIGAGPVKLAVTLDPNGPQVFTLPANLPTTITVSFPATAVPVERIQIGAEGDPGTMIELGDWNVVGSRVTAVNYSLVARADGIFRWAASGLLAKPMFLNLDYVRPRLDVNAVLDGGNVLVG